MKLNLKLTSLLLGTCILACPTASAMMEEDSSDRPCAAATAESTAEDINSMMEEAHKSLVFSRRSTPPNSRIDRFLDIGTVEHAEDRRQPKKHEELEVKYGGFGASFVINGTVVYNLPPDDMGHGNFSAIATHTPRNLGDLDLLSFLIVNSTEWNDRNVIIVIGKADGKNVFDYWNPDLKRRMIQPFQREGIRPLVHYAPSSSKFVDRGPGYEVYDVQFNRYENNEPFRCTAKNVRLYHFSDWEPGSVKPKNIDDFYNFAKAIIEDSNNGGKSLNAIVTCYGGTSRTGLCLACLKIIRDNLADIHTAGEAIEFVKKVVSELISRRTFMFKPEQVDMLCKMLLGHLHLI